MAGTVDRYPVEVVRAELAGGAAVLVPNTRILDAIEGVVSARFDAGAVRAPAVFFIDDWIRRTWKRAADAGIAPYCELRPLDAEEEALMWLERINEELDSTPLLDPEETAAIAGRAYRDMRLWRLDQARILAHDAAPDVGKFLRWAENFRRLCQKKGVIGLSDAIARMAREMDRDNPPPLPKRLTLLDFRHPPPLYDLLFECLAGATELRRETTLTTESPAASRRTFPDPQAEFVACARWARRVAEAEPYAHIGIIIAGGSEKDRWREFERTLAGELASESGLDLSSGRRPFNSSHAGRQLLEEAPVHDAFLLLGLAREEQSSDDLCRLLRSPFVLPGAATDSRLKMEHHMRRGFASRCRLSDFILQLGRMDEPRHRPRLLTALRAARPQRRRMQGPASPLEWTRRFIAVLDAFGWPGAPGGERTIAALKLWSGALETLARSAAVSERIDREAALRRLRAICSRTSVRPRFNPFLPVSVYTMTEAVGLRFDHVWLLNFNDQVWPEPPSPSPFLPWTLQRDARMPGSSGALQLELAEQDFDTLRRATKGELIASFHQADEEQEQELRLSAFATDFPESVATDEAATERSEQRHRLELAEDRIEFPLPESPEIEVGGHRVLSDQSACPFRAFVRHRLKAPKMEDFPSGLTMKTKGTIIHDALNRLFGRINGSEALAELDDRAAVRLCVDAARKAVEKGMKGAGRFGGAKLRDKLQDMEAKRVAELLRRFLELERKRPGFKVIAREQKRLWRHAGMVFRPVVDRIDRLADGDIVVIDYKTGRDSPAASGWLAERPEDIQMLLYCTAVAEGSPEPEEVRALIIVQIHIEQIGYSGLAAAATDNLPPSAKVKPLRSVEELAAATRRVADEFRRGVARVDPVRDACKFCGLRPLCRVREPLDAPWDEEP